MSLSVDVSLKFAPNFGGFALNAEFKSAQSPIVVFGRSGCGKTTLANVIAGLLTPDSGRIALGNLVLFDSENQQNIPSHKRGIAYVFQDARLFPHLTVDRNLRFGQRVSRRQARDQARDLAPSFEDVVQLLGLEDLLNRYPRHLSGGEQQRIAIGRALLSNPNMLIMDEPLANLDGARRHEVLSYIERLVEATDLPLLYISHSMEEVSRLGKDLLIMDKGKIAAVGPAQEILMRLDLRPMTGRYQAGALLSGIVQAHDPEFLVSTIAFGGGTLITPGLNHAIGTRIQFHIKAQDVSLSVSEPQGLSIRNNLPARIIDIQEDRSPYAEIALILPDGQKLMSRITRHALKDLDLVIGSDVFALIKSIVLSGHPHPNHRMSEQTIA